MKKKFVLPSKPGLARQYLIDNFSLVPDGHLKKGHILFLYLEHEKSIARTIRAVLEKLGGQMTVSPNNLNSIIHILDKYKNLQRENVMTNFVLVCSEDFTAFKEIPPTQTTFGTHNDSVMEVDDDVSHPSINSSDEMAQQVLPSPSQPKEQEVMQTAMQVLAPIRWSRGKASPRKLRMKKRIQFLSQMRSTEKKKFAEKEKMYKELCDIQKAKKMKRLNQDIERKKNTISLKVATIAKLRKEIKKLKEVEARDKGDIERELQQLKRIHKRLKNSNKHKRAESTATNSTVISLEEYYELLSNLGAKDERITSLEMENTCLQETLEELRKNSAEEKRTKKDGKTYSVDTRLMVYDAIVGQVPSQNIPNLIEHFAKRAGENLKDIPHRTTVEQMTRELGIIADLQTSEMAMKVADLTLGFDATTQEGTHINSIHFTTRKECEVVAVDELPGGTADDYHNHVCKSVDHLASIYSDFHAEDYQHCRSSIISNISNTMTDRVAVNHATIRKINETWGKSLNELNCHLHPLDTIASSCRSALKNLETVKGQLFGKDCLAGNIVYQVNRFRYKDGKGDPKGFKVFLDNEGLPRGIIPRYRGNRLHILFHICGKFIEHYEAFLKFFTIGNVSCGGLQSSTRTDFQNQTAVLEMQVLGLLGKILTGPWMHKFYTNADSEIDHIQGISLVRNVIDALKIYMEDPLAILNCQTDLFGDSLIDTDCTLQKLRVQPSPSNKEFLSEMIVACLSSVVAVLQQQYQRYFGIDITDQLRRETQSARCHNMDAEEVMGMFSAGQERARNATLCFLSSRIRAKKNKVVPYLDAMSKQTREQVVTWAIGMARKKRKSNRKKQAEIKEELSRRAAIKTQRKEERKVKNIEDKLKSTDIEDIRTVFPDLEDSLLSDLVGILTGDVVGRDICHVWYETDKKLKTVYSGRLEKLRKRKGNPSNYKVAYWGEGQCYDDAEDYEMSKFQLGADLICGDLELC